MLQKSVVKSVQAGTIAFIVCRYLFKCRKQTAVQAAPQASTPAEPAPEIVETIPVEEPVYIPEQQPIAGDLWAEWLFENGSLEDTSGNNRHLTAVNQPIVGNGYVEFDGTAKYFNVKIDETLPIASFSFRAYIDETISLIPFSSTDHQQWSDTYGSHTIAVNKGNIRHVWNKHTIKYACGTLTEALNPNFKPLSTGWHHFVIMFNSIDKTASVYIDGILYEWGSSDNYYTRDYNSMIPLNSGFLLQIGARVITPTYSFSKGMMSNVRIYSRNLTEQEVIYLTNE